MREIKFRAKMIDSDEMLYGYYHYLPLTDTHCIDVPMKDYKNSILYHAKPETVGQYTGLNDKNGKKIFEGDIVEENPVTHFDRTTLPCMVEFKDGMFGMWVKKLNQKGKWIKVWEALCTRYEWDGESHTRLEIIGNIHDNPELLEV